MASAMCTVSPDILRIVLMTATPEMALGAAPALEIQTHLAD